MGEVAGPGAPEEMAQAIRGAVRGAFLPDGTPYDGIGTSAVAEIARRFQKAGWEVERAAIDIRVWPERYTRNMKTFSPADQARLLGATVTVVGLGGLGGTVTEILARDGIGTLRLVDGDRFDESNLNRQLYSTVAGLGMPKAEAARRRIAQVNPSVAVSAHGVFLDQDTAAGLIRGSDVVVDCLDTLKYRFIMESAAKALGVPLVSAAIAGVAGHVTTIFPEDEGLCLVYGDRETVDEKGVERSLGCLPHAITILSALECAEVVKLLLGSPETLRNRLLVMDLSDYTFEIMELA
ncbi:ThiF family adenylyltransferase [Desulfococcus sp.]|uniref:HesA/MoeB/ThiF family protein n=1 Tax=Desulfococcus sp. TaxID=2025834 RepID=UPI0035946451